MDTQVRWLARATPWPSCSGVARGEPPRPGTQLPAPYRNPWSSLAEALRAVLADRRLALQRQWRRNTEGELPLPGFWPRGLAPLFWPLLLALTLALVLALGSHIPGVQRLKRPPAATVPADTIAGAERQPAIETEAPGSDSAQSNRSSGHNLPLEPLGAAPSRAPEVAEPSQTGEGGSAAPALQLDPLLELLSQGAGDDLLLAARPDPAGSRLSLILSQAAEALPQTELLEWAQRWQQRAREAGYERLELRDREGQLRGRGALVGSGMILLAPVPPA